MGGLYVLILSMVSWRCSRGCDLGASARLGVGMGVDSIACSPRLLRLLPWPLPAHPPTRRVRHLCATNTSSDPGICNDAHYTQVGQRRRLRLG